MIFEIHVGEPVRCGESSAVGGFPAVGDWRTRREVPSVVATGVVLCRRLTHHPRVSVRYVSRNTTPVRSSRETRPHGWLPYIYLDFFTQSNRITIVSDPNNSTPLGGPGEGL
ncbi:hypothetical protein [Nostoc sp.]|uniref:hypothetical protein n=1 Tax=Nostoc sp. TaxID=1180 RepID=UPI002FF8BE13